MKTLFLTLSLVIFTAGSSVWAQTNQEPKRDRSTANPALEKSPAQDKGQNNNDKYQGGKHNKKDKNTYERRNTQERRNSEQNLELMDGDEKNDQNIQKTERDHDKKSERREQPEHLTPNEDNPYQTNPIKDNPTAPNFDNEDQEKNPATNPQLEPEK